MYNDYFEDEQTMEIYQTANTLYNQICQFVENKVTLKVNTVDFDICFIISLLLNEHKIKPELEKDGFSLQRLSDYFQMDLSVLGVKSYAQENTMSQCGSETLVHLINYIGHEQNKMNCYDILENLHSIHMIAWYRWTERINGQGQFYHDSNTHQYILNVVYANPENKKDTRWIK